MSPAAKKFVLHWGEMGHAWGINRTMAQVHALLYISPDPIDAEEISATLDISRSNVSTSLRELIGWGIVERVHAIGDRRDRFVAQADVIETFRLISAERKRREIDPAIALLEQSLAETSDQNKADAHLRRQLGNLLEFTRLVSDWHGHIERLPAEALGRLLKGGAVLAKLLGDTPRRDSAAASRTSR
jgi:DNA-binding transcriptional regulator GbsR (MarR family)